MLNLIKRYRMHVGIGGVLFGVVLGFAMGEPQWSGALIVGMLAGYRLSELRHQPDPQEQLASS